jgi:hypothetical protein
MKALANEFNARLNADSVVEGGGGVRDTQAL